MWNSKELSRRLENLYQAVYSTIGVDFKSLDCKSKDNWFWNYYVDESVQKAVLKEHLKYVRGYNRELLSVNYWLGCSPSSVKKLLT